MKEYILQLILYTRKFSFFVHFEQVIFITERKKISFMYCFFIKIHL